jgi:glycosyltransferase involved in cell wall biosynthesis
MIRLKSELRTKIPKLVSVGRLFYRKGVDLLVSIIPEIVKQHPDL